MNGLKAPHTRTHGNVSSDRHTTGKHGPVLVLSGGGARGFAHAGVLHALEEHGIRPSAIVGVSMGAVVGTAYAMRADWYDAVLAMNTGAFPGPLPIARPGALGVVDRIRRAWAYTRTVEDMILSWGPGTRAQHAGIRALEVLLGDGNLESGRVPVAVSCTDLATGERVVLRAGRAADAVYASAALAGVLPPQRRGDQVLADGAYTDLAPIDVARTMGHPVVAVDAGQLTRDPTITNGLKAVVRAVEICHHRHADLRFAEADLVIRPEFERPIDTLEFAAARHCVAAGIAAARSALPDLDRLAKRD